MVTFPDSPPNGTEIIDRQDDGSVIIWSYNEDLNEWTYQQYGGGEPVRIFTDEILVRDNHQELPAGAFADPSELKTQKDVNYYLNESGGGGGGGDISMKPWIKIERFRREFSGGRPNGAPDFYCTYDVNNLAQYFWCWEMDLQADGTWVDIDDMSNADQSEIIGIQMEGYLRVRSQTSDKYPNAKIRYRITAELNDGESELSTSEELAYGSEVGDSPWDISYDPPLFTDGDAGSDLSKYATVDSVESLEDRVELLEKALLPYVTFNDRWCNYSKGSSSRDPAVDMVQYWDTSASGTWNWAWMVKMPATDSWIDVDDMTDQQKAEIGYLGNEDYAMLKLFPPEEDDMTDIEVKLKVTDEVEGLGTAEGWSESFWPKAVWIGQGSANVGYAAPVKKARGRLAQHIKE